MVETNESQVERESRLLLITFLTTTDSLLERLLQGLVLDVHELADRMGPQLQRIWRSARLTLKGVIESVRIGLESHSPRGAQSNWNVWGSLSGQVRTAHF